MWRQYKNYHARKIHKNKRVVVRLWHDKNLSFSTTNNVCYNFLKDIKWGCKRHKNILCVVEGWVSRSWHNSQFLNSNSCSDKNLIICNKNLTKLYITLISTTNPEILTTKWQKGQYTFTYATNYHLVLGILSAYPLYNQHFNVRRSGVPKFNKIYSKISTFRKNEFQKRSKETKKSK